MKGKKLIIRRISLVSGPAALALLLGALLLGAVALSLRSTHIAHSSGAAAALSGAQRQLLQQYMQVSLKLDAALDSLSAAQLPDLLRGFQQAQCAAAAFSGDPVVQGKAARRVDTVSGFTLFVYPGADFVSDHVADPSKGVWEGDELDNIRYALAQPVPGPSGSAAASSAGGRRQLEQQHQAPLFVDVGANIGWFSLGAARLGARVYAFEGLGENLALLRASLCANPRLQRRVTLYPLGLSAANDTCYLVAGDGNVGDGITRCGAASPEEAEAPYAGQGYFTRGRMLVRRMDDLVDEDVKVMKMDVEGHEHSILLGAQRLLTQRRVWYLVAEANRGIIKEEGAYKLVGLLLQHGYRVSNVGFKGPWITRADVDARAVKWGGVNVFAVRGELLGDKAAGGRR